MSTTTPTARMTNPAAVLPDATRGIQNIYKAIYAGGLDADLLELVHLRVSQLNGCSACVDAGIDSATKAGVETDRLLAVTAWYDSPRFDDAARAALTLAEAMTRLSEQPGDAVDDEVWDEVCEHFDERQRAALILMIALTNFFNRLNTTVRQPAGTRWS